MFDRTKQQAKKRLLSKLREKRIVHSWKSEYIDFECPSVSTWQSFKTQTTANSFSQILPLINKVQVESYNKLFHFPYLKQEHLALDYALTEFYTTKQKLGRLESIHQSLLAQVCDETDLSIHKDPHEKSEQTQTSLNSKPFRASEALNDLPYFQNLEISSRIDEWQHFYETVTLLISETKNKLFQWGKAINLHKSNIKLLTQICIFSQFQCHPHIVSKTFPSTGKVEDEIERCFLQNHQSNSFHHLINFKNDKGSKATVPKFTKQSDLRHEKQNIAA